MLVNRRYSPHPPAFCKTAVPTYKPVWKEYCDSKVPSKEHKDPSKAKTLNPQTNALLYQYYKLNLITTQNDDDYTSIYFHKVMLLHVNLFST